ncbi:Blue-light-activated histidine kinase 1 [Tsuneonella dongtanensis]|uniref:histidine kinase n=1 Tax=Tsuneonella dongtanensis TaxID=692370 RepID=A0A1B2A9J3_9SPHN|nr:CHASE3 domain-containing protein [Tsuneonella dongtanensis]ANY18725.1 Blue-light-activated histidine kinase 1 [Tsuneonella dongtanensis]
MTEETDTPSRQPATFYLPRTRGGWSSLGVFVVIAAALIGAIFLIFTTIEAERSERAQVFKTNEIMLELRNISRAAINAETGQRGYLITLDRRYLQPYHLGREQYRPAVPRLRALLGDSMTVRQRELVDEIETLADAKFAELAGSVRMIEQGDLLSARQLMLTDEGQEVMERLRLAVREMEEIERDILLDATEETARAEGRVVPLLLALLAIVLVTLWLGLRLSLRAARAEVEAAQANALAEARDRADLLARELNHRVKNLFAVILAIVRMSARDNPEAKPVVDRIAERIHALLTAHEVTQGTLETPVASLRSLVETTVRPYLTSTRTIELDGPEVDLPAKQVTPLGLVLHELTTNAVKYGCWQHGGTLAVQWRHVDEMIEIEWREHCPGEGVEPERQGFGSLLMTGAAKQLRGSIDRTFTKDGVRVKIKLPAT